MSVHVLGIRHHGPGSARTLRHALVDIAPDIVLIEGPREADAIAHLATDPQTRPPVAMLGYAVDRLDRAVFHPFASFSPEWVALTWAGAAGVPVRHIDLALTNWLAEWPTEPAALGVQHERPLDPLGELAGAAGYDDAERWWEDVVEHRGGGEAALEVFAAVGEAMQVLRSVTDPDLVPVDPIERRREAQMRAGIRAAVKEGHTRIAVVCGAWHVPALQRFGDPRLTRSDTQALRGMPKAKVAITWVPWTHRRLATASGYGAGVTSPGWYHHLFTHPGEHTIARWFTEAATVLRRHDYAVSAADVVEATRLAGVLATLRGRPLAGLAETSDAARAVLGDGTDTPMVLVSSELVVGTTIGRVPDHTPMVPLARDLAAEQKRCRLKPEVAPRTLELDLRKPLDRSRSQLLHRLSVLRIPWGKAVEGRGSAGTFRETWQLVWEPELEVRLIEASASGTTVPAAAESVVVQRALGAQSLAELTGAIEECLLADLTAPVPGIVRLVADRAAVDEDVSHLMQALPALVRTIRYGDVRGTDASALQTVVQGLVLRIAAGLAAACSGLDEGAAEALASDIDDTRAALSLLGEAQMMERFHLALAEIVERERVHPSLQGRATRLLADGGALDAVRVEQRVSRALSPGTAPADGAAFVEGFLGRSGTVLVHDAELLGLIDSWLASLDGAGFVDVLPLLRRTFGTFEPAERRQIGERVRGAGELPAGAGAGLDPDRVAAGLHTIAVLLGAPT